MAKAKLKIFYPDDIKRIFVTLIEKEPIVLRCGDDFEYLIKDASYMQVQWFEGEKIIKKNIEFEKRENELVFFKTKQTTEKKFSRQDYRVDYKGYIHIRRIEKDNVSKYQKKVHTESLEYENSMHSRIRTLLAHETAKSKYVLEFLLEIDNKLEDILAALEEKNVKDSYEKAKSIDIGGGGICFYSYNDYNVNEYLYVRGEIKELGHHTKFSFIGNIVNKEKSASGFFYGLSFITIDQEIVEEIIKYVFDKDRILLKYAGDR